MRGLYVSSCQCASTASSSHVPRARMPGLRGVTVHRLVVSVPWLSVHRFPLNRWSGPADGVLA